MQTKYQPQEKFMRRAFALATLGQGTVSPNPMVGCVVVYEDLVIGEGFHRRYGQSHAEVHAIDSVLQGNATVAGLIKKTGKTPQELLRCSTLYVTLEPCSHYGKTPPCARKIIETGIPRVVVSCGDPNPEVNGRGIRMLREAGIEVTEHFLESEGWEMSRRFFVHMGEKRPYVILKWARSIDNYIAASRTEKTAITGPILQVLNHSYRAGEDAVMVGTGTLLADNPQLDARLYDGVQPLRVSVDLHGRVLEAMRRNIGQGPPVLHFFDGTRSSLLFVDEKRVAEYAFLQEAVGEALKICPVPSVFIASSSAVGEVEVDSKDLPHSDAGFPLRSRSVPIPEKISPALSAEIIAFYLQTLQQEKIGSLIVEGGRELLESFIGCGLWDEARIFTSPKALGNGYPAPVLSQAEPVGSARYGAEWVHVYRNRNRQPR